MVNILNEKLGGLSQLNRTIHEPARLAILSILFVTDGADFLFLGKQAKLTKGNLSAHLGKLEDADLVEIEKSYVGKIPRTICRITDTGRIAFQAYLDQLKETIGSL